MTVEVWRLDRRSGREALFACRIKDDSGVVFESRTVALRLRSQKAAAWLARQVQVAHETGSRSSTRRLEWTGNLKDDCQAEWEGLFAHAEWLYGRRRGGSWYCAVTAADGRRVFHTADSCEVEPKNGFAARWLCELMIYLDRNDIVEPLNV